MEDKKQPIVIKKIIAGHGHHGGSWKVAFADFATAMMAFFMVLWLVGQTTAEKRGGIAEYFMNPSMVQGHAEAPTGSMGPGGSSMSLIKLGGTMDVQKQQPTKVEVEKFRDRQPSMTSYQRAIEKQRLENLMDELRELFGKSQALKPFKDQLLLDITPNGLRIQIVDKENRPMFDSGSARLKSYTQDILFSLSKMINQVPNKISISGHTDATPLAAKQGAYTNWELSTDRANAARRALIEGGMKPDKIARVLGLASTALFDKENPQSPINRRISIIVMKREISDALAEQEKTQADPSQLMQEDKNLEGLSKDIRQQHFEGLKQDMQLNQPADEPGSRRIRETVYEDTLGGMNLGNGSRKLKDQSQSEFNRSLKSQLPPDPALNNSQLFGQDRNNGSKPNSFINLPPIIDPALLPERDIKKE
jgi:chemotaxis protein MotB